MMWMRMMLVFVVCLTSVLVRADVDVDEVIREHQDVQGARLGVAIAMGQFTDKDDVEQSQDSYRFSQLSSASEENIDARCTLCQFFVERISADLFLPANFPPKTAKTVSQAAALLETDSQAQAFPRYIDTRFKRPKVFSSGQGDTSSKFSKQIFRVIDLVTEALCEHSMPLDIYKLICTPLYSHQEKLSLLLSRDIHNPLMVCTLLPGMCPPSAHVHSTVHGSLKGAGYSPPSDEELYGDESETN